MGAWAEEYCSPDSAAAAVMATSVEVMAADWSAECGVIYYVPSEAMSVGG